MDSYADKWSAERVASKVKGVKTGVIDIENRLTVDPYAYAAL